MPPKIRGAHFNSECTISAGNTLRIGTAWFDGKHRGGFTWSAVRTSLVASGG